ncbi:MAG: hypothetical protein QME54_06365 [Actinomycetota bacterium]|nr:hypothetical protein [Actinomycetota bacterium]
MVRKTVGYPRYDTEEELKVLNELLLFEAVHKFLPTDDEAR